MLTAFFRFFTGVCHRFPYAPAFLLLLFLGACHGEPTCIDAADKSMLVKSGRLTVGPNSGVVTVQTDPDMADFDIQAEGRIYLDCDENRVTVNLCASNAACGLAGAIPPAGGVPGGVAGALPGGGNRVVEAGADWTDSGITLGAGEFIIIKNITGEWTVRESSGNRLCLLATGVRTEGVCNATDGEGLYIATENSEDNGKEISTFFPGTQGEMLFVSSEMLGGGGALQMRYAHRKSYQDGELVGADPALPEYNYDVSGYNITYVHCTNAHVKEDGACLTEDTDAGGNRTFSIGGGGGGCANDGSPDNDFGAYEVSYRMSKDGVPEPSPFLSKIIIAYQNFLFGDDAAPGMIGRVYQATVGNDIVQRLIKGFMVLSVIFLGYGYISGVLYTDAKKLFNFFMKLVVVSALISTEGWDILERYVLVFFTEGIPDIIALYADTFTLFFEDVSIPQTQLNDGANIALATGYSESALQPYTPPPYEHAWEAIFMFYDLLLNLIFTKAFIFKLGSLLSSFPMGFVAVTAITVGIFYMLMGVAHILLSLIVAFTMLATSIIVLPVILPMWLFNKTSSIFVTLTQTIFAAFLVPIFVVPLLILISSFLYISLVGLFDFTACKLCLVRLDMGWLGTIIEVAANINLCLMQLYAPWGAGFNHPMEMRFANFPIGIGEMLTFTIFAVMTNRAIYFATGLAYNVSAMRPYLDPVEVVQRSVKGSARNYADVPVKRLGRPAGRYAVKPAAILAARGTKSAGEFMFVKPVRAMFSRRSGNNAGRGGSGNSGGGGSGNE